LETPGGKFLYCFSPTAIGRPVVEELAAIVRKINSTALAAKLPGPENLI